MRGRMRDASGKSYVPAFPLGKPLTNFGVSVSTDGLIKTVLIQ